MRAMVARALTGGLSLLLTGARCADATCTFTFDFTDFSRLRTSTAPSRVNRPQEQVPERAGPEGWRTGVTVFTAAEEWPMTGAGPLIRPMTPADRLALADFPSRV